MDKLSNRTPVYSEALRDYKMAPDEELRIMVARLEERLRASDIATKLAADALEAWKSNANEWRQALSDQRSMFVSRAEVISIMLLGLAALGLVLTALGIMLKFMK